MFKIGDKVSIKPVLTTSEFIAFDATVISNSNIYVSDDGSQERGWYIVEDADGDQFDTLATVTFAAEA